MYNYKPSTKTSTTAELEPPMLSLFEYLGKSAGPELGKQVYAVAKANKVKMSEQQVTTKTYSGKIMMYPKPFLVDYFGNQAKLDPQSNIAQDDELPF